MSNREKGLAAAESGRETIGLSLDTGDANVDPPPPYSRTFFEPPAAVSEPPPLPREPPVLTRQPSPVITNVIPGPGIQIEDHSTGWQSAWRNARNICCLALCYIWIPISLCVNYCARRCSKLKSRWRRYG